MVKYSSNGEPDLETVCTTVHQLLLIKEHTPPPFGSPVLSEVRSERCTLKPSGCTVLSRVFRPSRVSVKQNTLHIRRSFREPIKQCISSRLFSRDCRLARKITGMEGGDVRSRSLVSTPLRRPLLRRVRRWSLSSGVVFRTISSGKLGI